MKNFTSRLFGAAFAVVSLTTPANAFGPSDAINTTVTLGDCDIIAVVDPVQVSAGVYVTKSGSGFYFPDGTIIVSGHLNGGSPVLTELVISSLCFGDLTGGAGSEFDLVDVDPLTGSFASDDRTGFAIEVTGDMSGYPGALAKGRYNFYTNDFNSFTPPSTEDEDTADEEVNEEVNNEESRHKIVQDTMTSVQQNLVFNQPSLRSFLRNTGASGALRSRITGPQGNLDFNGGIDSAWVNFKSSWSDIDGVDTHYLLGAIGAHMEANSDLLIGAMLQFDTADQNATDGEINTQGYLFGPYASGKLADQPLYYDARVLFGTTNGELETTTGVTADFTSQRRLAMVNVEGVAKYERFELIPSLVLSHVSDRIGAYTDSAGSAIGAQTITQNAARFGLDAIFPIEQKFGDTRLGVGFSGTYADQSSSVDADFGGSNTTLGLNASVFHLFDNGATLTGRIDYDGLGTADYEVIGVELTYSYAF